MEKDNHKKLFKKLDKLDFKTKVLLIAKLEILDQIVKDLEQVQKERIKENEIN